VKPVIVPAPARAAERRPRETVAAQWRPGGAARAAGARAIGQGSCPRLRAVARGCPRGLRPLVPGESTRRRAGAQPTPRGPQPERANAAGYLPSW